MTGVYGGPAGGESAARLLALRGAGYRRLLPMPARSVGPEPFEVVVAAHLIEEHVDDEVPVVEQDPLGVGAPLGAQRGGPSGRLDLGLDLLSDGEHLAPVGPTGDDEGVGDPQDLL